MDDMIINKDDIITSGGYTVNSTFFNNEIPITSLINDTELFKGRSLPTGLIFLNTDKIDTHEVNEVCGVIDSSIYDKIFEHFTDNADENSPEESLEESLEEPLEPVENIEKKSTIEKNSTIEKSPSRKIKPNTQIKTRKQGKKHSRRIPKIVLKKTRKY